MLDLDLLKMDIGELNDITLSSDLLKLLSLQCSYEDNGKIIEPKFQLKIDEKYGELKLTLLTVSIGDPAGPTYEAFGTPIGIDALENIRQLLLWFGLFLCPGDLGGAYMMYQGLPEIIKNQYNGWEGYLKNLNVTLTPYQIKCANYASQVGSKLLDLAGFNGKKPEQISFSSIVA
ncbi:hypothetical protein OZX65_06635 [Leuconostocaceae bacterium ESL0723]|nr:hypothetical protein OZX65_06635 [Leuconostocaceae bacterium ESL0723]